MSSRELLVPLGLLLGAALCFAADARLDAAERASRLASQRLGPIVSEAAREQLSVAGLRLTQGGETVLYQRRGGVWRCSWNGALADERALSGFVEALLEARGPIDALAPEDAAAWGLDPAQALRLELLGPDLELRDDGDVRFAVDFGRSLPSVGGGFARVVGEDSVRTLDVDLGARLRGVDGVPPLIDRTLLGRALMPPDVQLTDMLVEMRGQPTVRLDERPSGATDDEIRRGAHAWLHVLVDDDGEATPTVAALVASFEAFLIAARWDELLRPDEAASVGLDRPEGRVVLARTRGEPIVLTVGPRLPDGRCAVHNSASNLGFLVPAEVARALRPVPDEFRAGTPTNVWDAWIGSGRFADRDR